MPEAVPNLGFLRLSGGFFGCSGETGRLRTKSEKLAQLLANVKHIDGATRALQMSKTKPNMVRKP